MLIKSNTRLLFGLVVFVAAPACHSDDGSSGSDAAGDGDAQAPHGECPHGERTGHFEVIHEPSYTAVDGEVADGVVPVSVLTIVDEVGDCRLMRRENPFCDPPCSSGQTCDFNGSCLDYPGLHPVGSVSVSGLKQAVNMEPGADSRYFDTGLPHPGFEPGNTVQLEASGGEIDAFTLYGETFTPFELEEDPTWVVKLGEDLDLTWPTGDDGATQIQIRLNIDQHGSSPVTLVCDVEDTGSYSVPNKLIDMLLSSGVSGFPSGDLYRRTVDNHVTSLGCVEFEIRSHIKSDLNVEGHTPCNSNDDCPGGLTCDVPNNTCV